MRRGLASAALLLAAGALLPACASDKYLGSSAHKVFAERDYPRAAEAYDKAAEPPGVNQFLFLVDAGTAHFAARQYDKAIDAFLRAEKLAEVKDYTSISEEAGTLLTSDNVRTYKGEDFEKVLVNVYLALAFAAQGKWEDAQVEARKINLLLYRMINEGKRNYQESPFARYLSGAMWEAGGDTNDAYVDYKKTYELDPNFPRLGEDLLATAQRMRFYDDVREWAQKFPGQRARIIPKGDGELLLVFERGVGPIKIPRDGDSSSLPRYLKRYSQVESARVWVDDLNVGNTVKVLDVDDTSVRFLEDRIGKLLAKKLAGHLAKGAVAAGVGKLTNDASLGWLTYYVLAATDRADLRSWLSLPAEFQMLRVPVKAGKHRVRVEAIGRGGEIVFTRDLGEVELRAGRKVFMTTR